ncbi:MAG: hypothetical protein AAB071_08045 [Bacteroidota bacterium]
MKLYYPYIAYFSELTVIIPIIASIILWKKLDAPLKLLFLYSCTGALFSGIELILALMRIRNTMVFHIYTIAEFLILVFIYKLLNKGRTFAWILNAELYGFLLAWPVLKFTLESFSKYDNYSATFSGVLLMVASLYTLGGVQKDSETTLLHTSRFWITAGIMIQVTGQILVLATSNGLVQIPVDQFFFVWTFHWVITIIVNMLFTGAILCRR